MANVTDKVTQIRNAVYGKDVRENIASGIEDINTETIGTTASQTVLNGQFNSLVINAGNSNAEIVAGRTSTVTGLTKDTIGHRVDGIDTSLAQNLQRKVNTSNAIYVEAFPKIAGDLDDTERINRAILFAQSNNINKIILAPIMYDVTKGTITTILGVEIEGTYGTDCSNIANKGATVLNAYNSTITAPVFSASVPNGQYIIGLKLSNMIILGSTGWTDQNPANWADRPALFTQNVAREFEFENVLITGFKREAWHSIQSQDGTVKGLTITSCGTDGLYYALNLDGTTDQTNAIHFLSLHMESCPLLLVIGKGARHNQFIGCKFETGGSIPVLHSPIVVLSTAQENVFDACQFVITDGTTIPYMITIGNMLTTIVNSMFTSPTNLGSKFIDSSACYGGKFNNNSFNCMLGTTYGILLGGNTELRNNTLWVNADGSGNKYGVSFGYNNIIEGNSVKTLIDSVPPTAGNIFYSVGTGNRLRNKFYATVFNKYNLSSYNTVKAWDDIYSQLTLNSTTPTLNADTDFYYVNNTATTTLYTFLGSHFIGKVITLLAKESLTTIINGTSILTKTVADEPLSPGMIKRFIWGDFGSGEKWIEI